MNSSLNETQSLIKAAARGAGLSWGEALDYALGMRWIATQGIKALDICADHLEMVAAGTVRPPNAFGPALKAEGALCPLRVGLLISDHRFALTEHDVITVQNLACPLLVLPFLALSGTSMRMHGEGFSVVVGTHGWAGQLPQNTPTDVSITADALVDPKHAMHTRVPTGETDRARLLALAANTYAPATEASRLAGAGAGLSDND